MTKYKFYSDFITKYAGNILRLQLKAWAWMPLLGGLMIMALFGYGLIIDPAPPVTAIVLTLAGLGLVLWGVHTYFTTWTFDRLRGVAVHRRPGLPEKTYDLDDIVAVHLDTRNLPHKGRVREEYRVVLEMADATYVPLSPYGGRDPQIEAQLALREFLDLEENP
ncbi:MAG: hypothetical protein GVY30_05750 [Chloroflexi bacterium]|jgi:hypothetical protein|nr:hypothetical protein [Chloroflexota bacterium]